MALNFSAKAKSNPQAPQAVQPAQARPQVSYGKPTQSTARADALKARLTGKPQAPIPTVAPRKAGSTARAEQYAAQPKYVTAPQAPQAPKPIGTSTARQQAGQEEFPAQPSGLAPGAQPPQSQITTSVETTPTVEATSQVVDPQLAALAKETTAIRKARLALKAEREAFQQERVGLVSKQDLLNDPLKVLSEAGLSYERLTELQLGQASPDPNQALIAKIEALEARLSKVDETFVDRDKKAYDAAVGQIKRDAQLLVDSDPAFETIKVNDELGGQFAVEGGTDAVVALMEKIFHEEAIVIPVEEACRLVEEKALNRQIERVKRLNALSKIKKSLEPPAENPEEANTPAATAPQQPKTLTNRDAVQKPMSARDRAILAFNRSQGVA